MEISRAATRSNSHTQHNTSHKSYRGLTALNGHVLIMGATIAAGVPIVTAKDMLRLIVEVRHIVVWTDQTVQGEQHVGGCLGNSAEEE